MKMAEYNNSRKSATPAGSPDKQGDVVVDLRRKIVEGTLAPGARLPTRQELTHEYGVSLATLQRAFDRLTADGFVTPRGKSGTFVAAVPPHLSQYGIVFAASKQEMGQSRLWMTLTQVGMGLADGVRKVHFYHRDADSRRQLVEDIADQRLAGVVFTAPPLEFAGTPVLAVDGLPRVAYMPQKTYPHVAAVNTDLRSFYSRAIAFLHGRGRRKLAMIGACFEREALAAWLQPAVALGMTVRPHWVLPFYGSGSHAFMAAREVANLLMRLPVADRPDALILNDDNLVPYATAGLAAAGVRGPADLDVVAHCNYPNPPVVSVPVTFLGFDMAALMAACADLIAQARGVPVNRPDLKADEINLLPAKFADELGVAARRDTGLSCAAQ